MTKPRQGPEQKECCRGIGEVLLVVVEAVEHSTVLDDEDIFDSRVDVAEAAGVVTGKEPVVVGHALGYIPRHERQDDDATNDEGQIEYLARGEVGLTHLRN